MTQAGFEPATPSSGGCAVLSNFKYLQTTPTARSRKEPQIPASLPKVGRRPRFGDLEAAIESCRARRYFLNLLDYLRRESVD